VRALLARYPRLAATLPRAALDVRETPVERWRVDGLTLLVKRDDLSSLMLGGNKVRALELLLAGAHQGRTLLTVGATGSTHALALARHGAWIGARTEVITWPQEMHDVAQATGASLAAIADVTRARSVAGAYLRAALRRLRGGVHWIPAGGSVPLGALGHVDAVLGLAEQCARAGVELPDVIVVPLGSGGTAAGILAGLAIAGLPTRVVGARVVPRIVANRRHVLRLANGTRDLLSHLAGVSLPRIDTRQLEVEHGAYGGAYGRETAGARAAMDAWREAGGPRLEPTYSAKALAVAIDRARRSPDERVLFWLTFDGRWLETGDHAPAALRPSPSPSAR
jgi:D-cysteine desulfhydrase